MESPFEGINDPVWRYRHRSYLISDRLESRR